MHASVIEFVRRILTRDIVEGRSVLEVGSAYVNGSYRAYVESLGPKCYIGVDAESGVGVDVVADCEHLARDAGGHYDLVLTTEMLEHVRDWRTCVAELATVTAPGGLLLVTTRSPGFQYHAYPEDHWRYTLTDMKEICRALGFDIVTLEDDPEKRGVFLLARKPMVWNPNFGALEDVTVEPIKRFPRKDKDPDEPVKQVVCFPLYQSLSTKFFMSWLGMNTSHVVATASGDGSMDLPRKMDAIVQTAFDTAPDLDQIVIMEQDMICPQDGLVRMAQYDLDEHHIVGSVFTKHDYPYHYMAWMQVDPPRFSPLTRSIVKEWVDSPGLYPVDGVAMGFTAISRRVFEDWDHPGVPMWQPVPPMVGHDLHFCNEAKKQGFNVWLDSGLGCGHLTLVEIGHGHAQEALAIDEPESWEQALARVEPVSTGRVL